MRKHLNLLHFFFFVLLYALSATSYGALPLDNSIAPMLQKVLPAVVNIRAQIKITDLNTFREIQKQRRMSPQDNAESDNQPMPSTFVSVGSGVIVDAKNGYLLTNAHVVNNAQTVTVTLANSRQYTAKVIGMDKPSDIALLQIKAQNLTAIPLGDSSKLKVGDFVAAIGNPFGLNQTVTSGIVSALGRNTLGIETYENFIQTDAPINPGNSGGALISMAGDLVGINTAILGSGANQGSIGIGFAIPANMAKSVMQQLIEFGNVQHGILGIVAQNITPELADAFNLKTADAAAISMVKPFSPAEQAGLKAGDIITGINGNEIKSAGDVVNITGFLRVGSKITIDIIRDNKPIKVSATLSDIKKIRQNLVQKDPFLYGLGLKNFTLTSPDHGDIHGILIVSVEEDSNAWHANLRPGDIVTSANRQTVSTIDQLKSIAASASNTLLLNVTRGPGALYLIINKEL